MSIKKSKTMKELERLRIGPLVFKDMLLSLRTAEEMSQVELA